MAVHNRTKPRPASQGRSILTVVVSLDGEGLEERTVVACPTPIPGLLVHRSPWDPTGWAVTHAKSGTALTARSWPTKQAAIALAGRLGPLADWTADEDQLWATLDRHPGRVRQTAEALAAELGLTAGEACRW